MTDSNYSEKFNKPYRVAGHAANLNSTAVNAHRVTLQNNKLQILRNTTHGG